MLPVVQFKSQRPAIPLPSLNTLSNFKISQKIYLPIVSALISSVGVSLYWVWGTPVRTVFQAYTAPESKPFGWVHFALLVAIALVFAGLGNRYPLKSLSVGAAAFIAVWTILAVLMANLSEVYLAVIPLSLVVGSTLLIAHFAKLWVIDSKLTGKLVTMASTGTILSGHTPEMRVETGLRLLETMFPVSEVIVFNLEKEGVLVPVGRARKDEKDISPNKRIESWQQKIVQCEQAIKESSTVVKVSEYQENAASLAVPLVCEDDLVGVLFVDIRDDYEEADKLLLESFAGQLARNFQRKELKNRNLPHSNWWSSFSTQSSENRLHAVSLVDGVIKEKSFGSLATAHLHEAHALAYLDGTLAYLNPKICELAKIGEGQIDDINLFSLLDRFRTLVFNDPSLAIRRVMQTGRSYTCELEFPDNTDVLQLEIIPVKLPTDVSSSQNGESSGQPACLLVTLQNIAAKKENERLRSDMASLMSHELRTPITSINGFAEMLLMDGSIPPDAREYLSIIASESQRASQMLSNFLSVANLEQSDKKEVDKAPIRVNAIVHEVVEELQDLAKQKRIRIVEKQSEEVPPVSADRGLITKAISHLLDNAIKYSPERTSVIISTILEADFLRVDVEDRGYGIPAGEHQKIWQKFYRVARDGRDKEEESTGLGLSLVKEIAEQHNGEVSVQSSVGRGSRFSLRLPRL